MVHTTVTTVPDGAEHLLVEARDAGEVRPVRRLLSARVRGARAHVPDCVDAVHLLGDGLGGLGLQHAVPGRGDGGHAARVQRLRVRRRERAEHGARQGPPVDGLGPRLRVDLVLEVLEALEVLEVFELGFA